jgi:ankyrin repeat protein
VQCLVQRGADKDTADNNGCTSLHCAAGSGHADVVVCLLSHGAKLNVRNKAGKLPVDIAATEEIKQIIRDEEQRRRDVVRSRIAAGQKEAADHAVLMSAAADGDLAVVKEYVTTHKVDVNKADDDDRSPLCAAAREGHLLVVQWLVEQGADKEKTDNACWTPLNAAAFNGHLEVVQWLAEQGADKEKADEDGWTSLHTAAGEGHLSVAHSATAPS